MEKCLYRLKLSLKPCQTNQQGLCKAQDIMIKIDI